MRMIDADAIPYTMLYKEDFMRGTGVEKLGVWKDVIDAMPTIERTGKWIKITTGAMREKYMCSICGRTIEEDGIERLVPIKYPFCHCGAKMEGESGN